MGGHDPGAGRNGAGAGRGGAGWQVDAEEMVRTVAEERGLDRDGFQQGVLASAEMAADTAVAAERAGNGEKAGAAAGERAAEAEAGAGGAGVAGRGWVSGAEAIRAFKAGLMAAKESRGATMAR